MRVNTTITTLNQDDSEDMTNIGGPSSPLVSASHSDYNMGIAVFHPSTSYGDSKVVTTVFRPEPKVAICHPILRSSINTTSSHIVERAARHLPELLNTLFQKEDELSDAGNQEHCTQLEGEIVEVERRILNRVIIIRSGRHSQRYIFFSHPSDEGSHSSLTLLYLINIIRYLRRGVYLRPCERRSSLIQFTDSVDSLNTIDDQCFWPIETGEDICDLIHGDNGEDYDTIEISSDED